MEVIINAKIPGKKVKGGALDIYHMKLINMGHNFVGPYRIRVTERGTRHGAEIWLSSYRAKESTGKDAQESALQIFNENLLAAYKRGPQSEPYSPVDTYGLYDLSTVEV
jgi:hypothetical protein